MPDASETQIAADLDELIPADNTPTADPALRAELDELKRRVAEKESESAAVERLHRNAETFDRLRELNDDDAEPEELTPTEPAWPHDTLEFKGETLQIRIPDQGSITGMGIAFGKYVPEEVQTNLYRRFLSAHLSEDSLENVFSRLFNPDDPEFGAEAMGDLIGALMKAGVDKITADKAADTAP